MTIGQPPTNDGPAGEGSDSAAPPGGPDPLALARDWMTLVQTELAGLAADREAQEMVHALGQGMAAMWAQAARGLVPPVAPADDPARAAAPSAASGAGDASGDGAGDGAGDGIARILGRLDALERRIGELERAAGRPAPRPAPRRRGPAAG